MRAMSPSALATNIASASVSSMAASGYAAISSGVRGCSATSQSEVAVLIHVSTSRLRAPLDAIVPREKPSSKPRRMFCTQSSCIRRLQRLDVFDRRVQRSQFLPECLSLFQKCRRFKKRVRTVGTQRVWQIWTNSSDAITHPFQFFRILRLFRPMHTDRCGQLSLSSVHC